MGLAVRPCVSIHMNYMTQLTVSVRLHESNVHEIETFHLNFHEPWHFRLQAVGLCVTRIGLALEVAGSPDT